MTPYVKALITVSSTVKKVGRLPEIPKGTFSEPSDGQGVRVAHKGKDAVYRALHSAKVVETLSRRGFSVEEVDEKHSLVHRK